MEEEFGTLGVKVARRILLHVDVEFSLFKNHW